MNTDIEDVALRYAQAKDQIKELTGVVSELKTHLETNVDKDSTLELPDGGKIFWKANPAKYQFNDDIVGQESALKEKHKEEMVVIDELKKDAIASGEAINISGSHIEYRGVNKGEDDK